MDIPDDNEKERKTFNMGFLHTLLGTGEKEVKLWFSVNNCENIQVLFFIVSVMVEIFANVSGTSLIYLLWRTDFLFTHGILIVGCKVGTTLQHYNVSNMFFQ